MILDNALHFEPKHFVIINNIEQKLLYFFDYDERSATVNMEFQHFHQYHEIMVFLGQDGEHLFEGNPYHMHFGDIALIPPYMLHKSIYRKGSSSKRIIIAFQYPENWMDESVGYPQLLSTFSSEPHIHRFAPEQRLKLFEKLNKIMDYSLNHDYHENPMDHLMIHSYFVEFLHDMYDLKEENIYQNDMSTSPTAQKMYSIASYIHQNYSKPISLNALAEHFYINPYYLSHCFKDTLQFTVSDYIQITRVRNAQHQLLASNDKITDIASNCGFTSFSQFNRIFRKHTDDSPRDYRKRRFDGISI